MLWYNVENFFHPEVDSVNRDTDFTPEGRYRWSYSRYHAKIDHIAQVIANAAGWNGVDVVGLCEVEDAKCLSDLCRRLSRFGYRWVHFDSPDPRGIDVALLYRPNCTLLDARTIPCEMPNATPTRDILYACIRSPRADTVHLYLCHLPSQRGGYANTEPRRQAIKTLLQYEIDSLQQASANAKIVVVGDMNSAPKSDLTGMCNPMVSLRKTTAQTTVQGTYKHQGRWSFLDQCYLSEDVSAKVEVYAPSYLLEEDERYLDVRPCRTFVGIRYRAGYSDHLPLLITFQ